MPPIPNRPERALTDRELADARVAAWQDFARPGDWKVSQKGNLWRRWQDRLVTGFRRRDGRYGWSMGETLGGDAHFSAQGFDTEDDAMLDLFDNLSAS